MSLNRLLFIHFNLIVTYGYRPCKITDSTDRNLVGITMFSKINIFPHRNGKEWNGIWREYGINQNKFLFLIILVFILLVANKFKN